MLHLVRTADRSLMVGAALGLAVIGGWGGLVYSHFSSRAEIGALTVERDGVVAQHRRLREAVGDLAQVQEKLAATRAEQARAEQNLAETKRKHAAAQQELATLTKRVDAAKERGPKTTGSISPEPPKPPSRKPPQQ